MATVTLAGCLGDEGDDETDDTGRQGPMVGDLELSSSFPIVLYDAETGDIATDLHHHQEEGHSHWHRIPVEVGANEERTFDIELHDAHDDPITIGDDVDLSVATDDTETIAVELSDATLCMTGREPGEAQVTFTVQHESGAWTTPPLDCRVIE